MPIEAAEAARGSIEEVIPSMRGKLALLTLVAALCLGASVALAQEGTTERKYVEPTEADIAINNFLFFRIRTPAAGYKVVEREKIINQRLVDILSYRAPGPVTISPIRGKPTIYVDGIKLVTVYPRDVEANNAGSMHRLAAIWAERVGKGIPKVMPGARGPDPESRPVGASSENPAETVPFE
jgi:hypothetical protein